MKAANADCGLVVTTEGGLIGILTDTDVTSKVIAPDLSPEEVAVKDAMTSAPVCVRASESAVEALCTMVERRFRHLPVLDESGAVVGVLDIAKCLYDAISRLERHLSSASSALSTAVLAALPSHGVTGNGAQNLVDGMVTKLFAPSLADLLQTASNARAASGHAVCSATLPPDTTLVDAAVLMASRKSAVLITTERAACAGILTPKDVLFKVVAKGKRASEVRLEDVMTRSPDTMTATASVLEALHQLQYGGYRNVPVLSETGEPLGVLDVLTLMEGAMPKQKAGNAGNQWRGLLTSAESLVGIPSAPPQHPSRASQHSGSRPSSQVDENSHPPSSSSHPPHAANGLTTRASSIAPEGSVEGDASAAGGAATFMFKVTEPRTQHMHRIHSPRSDLDALINALKLKFGSSDESHPLVLRYDDDEGDRVRITTDEELSEACAIASQLGKKGLVLHASYESSAPAPAPLSDVNGRIASTAGKWGAKMLGSTLGTRMPPHPPSTLLSSAPSKPPPPPPLERRWDERAGADRGRRCDPGHPHVRRVGTHRPLRFVHDERLPMIFPIAARFWALLAHEWRRLLRALKGVAG